MWTAPADRYENVRSYYRSKNRSSIAVMYYVEVKHAMSQARHIF